MDARRVLESGSGPQLLLWSAASRQAIALCRQDGLPVWHAQFRHGLVVDSEATAAELAALQAIVVAGRACRRAGIGVAILHLVIARQRDLSMGAIHAAAFAEGLLLNLSVDDTAANPAVGHLNDRAPIFWRSTSLDQLLYDPGRPL
ncbi:hypothetical protein IU500_18550 [Nocardia terpenica]|uniref:hypothetical protein n=1 Tax=Nocardia terpenica TaxID=455432 RepID=UPI0018944743|nr:hypothetical protein [Nocardia terpenica]MBF6063487.1 hypothetical protein [Nocardia terpenica]MBF6106043.1 hypothetical protein [Nocardia terpenica]MBF6113372.1 hypothetical protein [Nocardia terpenica]MBF6119784.1 hypothetical protein [Nocardia terpenica]MBF6152195.1 hypothetical protein [Nocardia terpenica]